MKAPKNKIIIRTDRKWYDSADLGGGKKIFIDTTFDREQYAAIEAEVVAASEVISKDILRKHIAPVVKPGDRIYFHYNQFLDDDNLFVFGGEEYWMLDYETAFCVERDGELIAIGDYVLVSPPAAVELKSDLLVFAEGWKTEMPKNLGTLKLIGPPPPNAPALECVAGDTVWFQNNCEFENTIAGEKVWVMRQENLLGYARRGA